nr:LysR family transcriptional regulator [Maliibacterium massiliense]
MIDRRIYTLLALVQSGSYTKTAQMLNMTQPAVSHQVKQLEQDYNIKLFYSDKKELKLTAEGAILIKYARRAVAIAHSAQQAIEDNKRSVERFSIGITPTATEYLLPQVMAMYCNEHPRTHINIATDSINNIYNRMKAYELDLAIVEGVIPDANYTSVLLDTDYMCLAVSPRHRFAKRKSVSMEEMKHERFILRSAGAGTRELFEDYLKRHGDTLDNFNIIIEIDNVTTIKELVTLDLGITIIAHSACREDEQTGRLAVVPIENARMVREINMVHHKDFNHPEILDDLRRLYNSVRY